MLHFTLPLSPMTLRVGTRVNACVIARLSLILTLAATLGACGSFNSASTSMASLVSPYKIDVVQGNFVSRE